MYALHLVHACIYISLSLYSYTYICIYIYTYIHTYIHTVYTLIHITSTSNPLQVWQSFGTWWVSHLKCDWCDATGRHLLERGEWNARCLWVVSWGPGVQGTQGWVFGMTFSDIVAMIPTGSDEKPFLKALILNLVIPWKFPISWPLANGQGENDNYIYIVI